MRKIILNNERSNTISFSSVDKSQPIFAKKEGKLAGMVIHEDKGWILRVGGIFGSHGYWDSLYDCLKKGEQYDFEFYIED